MNKHYALFQIAGVLALVQGIVLAISTGWVILPLAFISSFNYCWGQIS